MVDKASNGVKKRVLIVGAGTAGRKVVSEMRKESRPDIILVGFVDDDPKKRKLTIRGAKVLGAVRDLPRLVKKKRVDQVLISMPSVDRGLVQRIAKIVPQGVSVKILPSIASVILGHVDLSYVRDIDPSDLIGRPLVKSDQKYISDKAKGKTFLVTGGAGSIGSELVRQLYDSKAKRIVVVDSWEEGIFNITEEMGEKRAGRPELRAYIADIRDKRRVEDIVKRWKPDVILHAAAYKHVPLMEENPEEARKTNVLGTRNMLYIAARCGVKDFILISTDKAVNPKSVMGRTKRDAELLVKRFAKKYPRRRSCSVRFGNVVNSSGSIVPKFVRQIRSRSPVTITDTRMTRYFMSIPEAVSLVLLSWILAKNGQILVLDMGEPVKIIDLAVNLIRMHGLEPHTDIPIREIGARKGEKIREELAYDKRLLRPSEDPRIFIAEDIAS
ncbi:MAG: polysaccharide biosynthesis protein [Patescibacteria group bacterium]|nr:polysaccharide biosynthesis protein [Patescibacteria group bacterium]